MKKNGGIPNRKGKSNTQEEILVKKSIRMENYVITPNILLFELNLSNFMKTRKHFEQWQDAIFNNQLQT